MRITKTIKIRIGDLTNHKKDVVDSLFYKNLKGLNHCIDVIDKKKIYSKTKLHKEVYQDLRKLDLPACLCHSIREKSIEIMKSFKSKKQKKEKPELKISRVRYDNQVTKLLKTTTKTYPYFVSLLYNKSQQGKSNRIKLPLLVSSEYQKKALLGLDKKEYSLCSSELVEKKGKYYFHLTYSKEIELPVPDETFAPIGIDIGINNLAVSVASSSTEFFSGKRARWKRKFFRKQRQNLQQNLALQELKRQKNREWRWITSINHNISNKIVEQAKTETKPVIVLEDLKYIRDNSMKLNKTTRTMVNSWAFRQLQNMIIYKANWEEIPVEFVDAKYSSQLCNKCHHLGNREKHTFKCSNCHYECNADYNAGRNLQHFFRAKCLGEQATINLASDIGSPEPQAEKDTSVRNLNKLNR